MKAAAAGSVRRFFVIAALGIFLIFVARPSCRVVPEKHAPTPDPTRTPDPSPDPAGRDDRSIKEELEERIRLDPDDDGARLHLGKILYFEGIAGDSRAADRALEILEELEAKRPEDAEVLAYSGSAILWSATKTLLFWRMGTIARRGLRKLDRAVDLAPEDPHVRFLRGIATYHLPGWFDREEESEADLRFVAAQAEEAVRDGRIDPWLAAAALYHEGVFLEREERLDEAKESWRRAVEVSPGSRAGKDAAKRLEELR